MAMGFPKLGWHGTRKRANGKYQARWVDHEGMKSEMFLTKTQADTQALRMANAALNVRVGLATLQKPIDEAKALFLARRTKPNTRALNDRRLSEFLAAMPAVKTTAALTNATMNEYALILEEEGHNPGGQQHHLKIIRCFAKFCFKNKWVSEYAFEDFVLPSSEFQARRLTDEEYTRMLGPRPWKGGNQHSDETWANGGNQYKDADLWLNRAFRFGHSTMLRISQVWKICPADFREPNLLVVDPIKGQEPVTIVLQPEAVAVLREIPIRAPQERYFSYWGSEQALRNSVEDKATSVGLKGVRFHDVCKVSRVSKLSSEGVGLAELAHLSNTSKKTLIDTYILADRDEAFAQYARRPSTELGQPRASLGPTNEGFEGNKEVQQAHEGSTSTSENASTSPQILAVRR